MVKDSLKGLFDNYNPDEDPNGAIGRDLADRAMKRFNGDTKAIAEWFQKGKISLDRQLEQAIQERDAEEAAKPIREEQYNCFLQKAERIKNYQTKLMGNLLVEYFPEIYGVGRDRQLKGLRLPDVKKEFYRKKRDITSYLDNRE